MAVFALKKGQMIKSQNLPITAFAIESSISLNCVTCLAVIFVVFHTIIISQCQLEEGHYFPTQQFLSNLEI